MDSGGFTAFPDISDNFKYGHAVIKTTLFLSKSPGDSLPVQSANHFGRCPSCISSHS